MASSLDSTFSSPDPLTVPLKTAPDPSSRRNHIQSITPKKPLAASNGNIRLQDFYLTTPPAGLTRDSSPNRSIAQTENLVSPWRIRVTVEAEKEESTEKQATPSKSLSERIAKRTTTTTVPLRGGDDTTPIPPKRGRGRPRKLQGTPIKRNGTPKPRKYTPRKARTMAEEAEQSETIPSKTRVRRSNNLVSSLEANDVVQRAPPASRLDKILSSTNRQEPGGRSPQTRSKGRRKAMSPVNIANDSGLSVKDESVQTAVERSMNAKHEEVKESERHMCQEQGSSTSRTLSARFPASPSISTGTLEQPRASPSPNIHSISRSPSHQANKFEVEDSPINPMDEHYEYDSIMESEGFTMISISTLPSAQQQLSTSREGQTNTSSLPRYVPTPVFAKTTAAERDHPSSTRRPEGSSLKMIPLPKPASSEDSSLLLDNQASPLTFRNSSRLYELTKQKTPSQSFSSPALPTPIQAAPVGQTPCSFNEPTSAMPSLVHVAQAGMVLQGVLDPKMNITSSRPPQETSETSSPKSPEDGLDDLFSGFGAGTRRELKAGLRLGEELAKRQCLAEQEAIAVSEPAIQEFQDAVISEGVRLPNPNRAKSYAPSPSVPPPQVSYPVMPTAPSTKQLPSPERSDADDEYDRMIWKADNAAKAASGTVLRAQDPNPPNDGVDHTMLAKEAQWQLEREAISRQIQAANTSQVIVIDSDGSDSGQENTEAEDAEDDHEDEGEIDVWRAAAKSFLVDKHTSSMEKSELLCAVELHKSRRNKLPSPWRRRNQMPYGNEMVDEDEECFWRPDLKHARTPTDTLARKRTKYEESACSVLSDIVGHAGVDYLSRVEDSPRSEIVLEEIVRPTQEIPAAQSIVPGNSGSNGQGYQNATADPSDTEERSHQKSNAVPEFSIGETITHKVEVPIQQPSLNVPVSASSWLGELFSFVANLRALMPSFTATAEVAKDASHQTPSPPRVSQNSELLPVCLPWETAHYRALRSIYRAAKSDRTLHPFNPTSPSAWLLGREVESVGWKKCITKLDIGVVDAFLAKLHAEGIRDKDWDDRGRLPEPIDEAEVAKRVFSLWAGGVQRGETPLGKGVAGVFDKKHRWRKGAVLMEAASRDAR